MHLLEAKMSLGVRKQLQLKECYCLASTAISSTILTKYMKRQFNLWFTLLFSRYEKMNWTFVNRDKTDNFQWVIGDPTNMWAHMKGLKGMLTHRGGIKELQNLKLRQLLVLWVSLSWNSYNKLTNLAPITCFLAPSNETYILCNRKIPSLYRVLSRILNHTAPHYSPQTPNSRIFIKGWV